MTYDPSPWKNVWRQFRLVAFVLLLNGCLWILPKDSYATLEWLTKLPTER